MTAIARGADRKEPIAASTDFLPERRVHDVEAAAARFDWTRLANRGTRDRTDSVRRSIEAVTEGLEVSAPGPHLDPPQGRQIINSTPEFRGGARRQPGLCASALTRAGERLHHPSFNIKLGKRSEVRANRQEFKFTRFQMTADIWVMPMLKTEYR
jgi:hypothetical protein